MGDGSGLAFLYPVNTQPGRLQAIPVEGVIAGDNMLLQYNSVIDGIAKHDGKSSSNTRRHGATVIGPAGSHCDRTSGERLARIYTRNLCWSPRASVGNNRCSGWYRYDPTKDSPENGGGEPVCRLVLVSACL